MSQEPVDIDFKFSVETTDRLALQTLYAGTIRFNILLGATKPASEITQEEIEAACCDCQHHRFHSITSRVRPLYDASLPITDTKVVDSIPM